MKYPVILVVSEGQVSPESIIESNELHFLPLKTFLSEFPVPDIRKKPPTEDVDQLMTLPAGDIVGCKLHLVTKYYQTDLYLVPFKEDISLLPAEIQEAIEAVLIYFDFGKVFRYSKLSCANFLKILLAELFRSHSSLRPVLEKQRDRTWYSALRQSL